MLSGVWPGRVEHLHARVAELDLLAVAKRLERKGDVRGLVQAVGGAGLPRERRAAGAVVGVHVGVDDVRDAHALRRGERDVCVDVLLVGVDDGALAERCRSRTGTPRSRSRSSSRA